jgi:hypothetical protein
VISDKDDEKKLAKEYFDGKRADQTGLPDLAAIQEFELLCPHPHDATRHDAVSYYG